ncbi:MAG: fibronectin type III domain-containing protein [Bacteroidales bacterium]|nr:fibronectin type III domain-containing protein [Bacteroidales bacterium]
MKMRIGFLLAAILLLSARSFSQNMDVGADGKLILPYETNFDDATDINMWTIHTSYTDKNLTKPSTYPTNIYTSGAEYKHNGSAGALRFTYYGSGYAVMPAISNDTDIKKLRLSFYAYPRGVSNISQVGTFEIGLMTNPNDISTFTSIYTVTPTANKTWQLETVTFENVDATKGKHIAFKRTQAENLGGTSYGWSIDDLLLEEIADCEAIDKNSLVISNIENTSAVVSFTDSHSNSSWNIYYRKKGYDGQWDKYATTTKTTSLPNLEAATAYELYVAADCGAKGESAPSSVVTFFTKAYNNNVSGEFIFDLSDTDNIEDHWLSVSTSANKWIIGSQVDGADNALYISNDGSQNLYSDVITQAYASIPLTFDDKSVSSISFDYKVNGASISAYTSFSAFVIDGGKALPESGIPLEADIIVNKVSQVTDWTTATFATDKYSGTSKQLVFYWEVASTNSAYHEDPPAAVRDIIIRTSNCSIPANIAKVSSTQTSATIKWDQEGTVDSWKIFYKEKEAAEDQWTYTEIEGSSEKQYTINGLYADEFYYVYVTAVCEGQDVGSTQRILIHTDCSTISELEWNDDFDNFDDFTCWKVVTNDFEYPKVTSDNNIAYSGSNFAEFANNNGLIVSPAIGENIEKLRFSAMFRSTSLSSEATVEIGVMSNTNDASSFSAIGTVPNPDNTEWFRYSVDFEQSEIKGANNYIAIRYSSNNTDIKWYMDDVTIGYGVSDCRAPEFNSLVATNPTQTTVNIAFTDNDETHNAWKFYYKNINANAKMPWNSFNLSSQSATVTGLSALTTYEAYVSTICEGTEVEDSTKHIFFTTTCGKLTESGFPYRNDFSDTLNKVGPDCWQIVQLPHYADQDGSDGEIYPSYGYRDDFREEALMFFRGNCGIVTPQLGVDIRKVELSFDYWENAVYWNKLGGELKIGTMSDPNNMDTWEEITSITDIQFTAQKAYVSFADALENIGTDNYIAFRFYPDKDINAGDYRYHGWYIDNVEISVVGDCASPVKNSVKVTNITEVSAEVSFSDNNENHDKWMVYYQQEGSKEVDSIETSSTQITLTKLIPSTSYTVWVRTLCESEGEEITGTDSTSAHVFFTRGFAVTPDVTINFEDASASQYIATSSNCINKWIISSAVANKQTGESTANSLYISNDGNSHSATKSTSENDGWYAYAIINIDFGSASEYNLSFDYQCEGQLKRGVLYAYLLDKDTEIPFAGLPDITNGMDLLGTAGYNRPNWVKYSNKISGVKNSSKQLVFVWFNDGNFTENSKPAAIDNISITAVPCSAPVIKIKSIEPEQATFYWEDNGGDFWTASYVKTGESDYTVQTVNDTFVTITNLEKNTSYKIVVASDCGENGKQTSVAVEFTTPKSIAVVGKDGYFNDLEDSEKNDVFSYKSNNYEQEYHNAWTIGKAAHEYLGQDGHALYISKDKNQYEYEYTTTSACFATFPVKFGEFEEYQLQFDYMFPGGGGNTNTKLEVYVMPSDFKMPASLTDGHELSTFKYDDARLTVINSGTEWTEFFSGPIKNVQNETRQIVFYWYNYGIKNSTEYNFNPPIAIDNIRIVGSNCPQNINLTVSDIKDENVKLSWQSNNDVNAWDITYTEASSKTKFTKSITREEVTVEKNKNADTVHTYVLYNNLLAGHRYSIQITSKCDDNTLSNPSNLVKFSTLGKTVKTFPFEQTFEDAEKNNTFSFSGVGNNQWYIGEAVGVNDGLGEGQSHSMYISSDQGETQSYNPHSSSYAYAAMNILFGEKSEYNIEFDYFVGGRESADNFNVFLIPIDQEIPVKGYINANDTMILYSYGVNSFKHVSFKLDTVQGKHYQLVFMWKNTSVAASLPAPAVDNIRITESDCWSVNNLRSEGRKQTTSIALKWENNSEADPQYYTVYYRPRSEYSLPWESTTTEQTSIVLENLAPGTNYSIKVTANCSDKDESVITYMEESTICDPVPDGEFWSESFELNEYVENRSMPLCWIRLKAEPALDGLTKRYIYFPSVVTYGNEGYNEGAAALEFRGGEQVIATRSFASKIENTTLTFYAKTNYTGQSSAGLFGNNDYAFGGTLNIYIASDIYDTLTWELAHTMRASDLKPEYDEFRIPFQNVVNRGRNKSIVFSYADTTVYSLYIDDIRLESAPDDDIIDACDNTLTISVKNAVAIDGILTTPETESATIEWTTTGLETHWDYALGLNTMVTTTNQSVAFSNLIPGQEYTVSVRLHCVDEDGKETGEVSPWKDITFKTSGSTPQCDPVTSLEVVSVTENTVKVSWEGDVSDGTNYEVAIAKDKNSDELLSSEIKTVSVNEASFNGLTDGTTYKVFVRKVCQFNSSEWTELEVTTVMAWKKPVVTTKTATSITAISAKLNGTVTAYTETIQERGFEVRLSKEDITKAVKYQSTSNESSFSYIIDNLDPQTEYSYRAYVISIKDTQYSGAWEKFKTLEWNPTKPTVTTYPVDITTLDSVSVTLKGKVIEGEENITKKGFIYKSASLGDVEIDMTSAGEDFSYNLTGLQYETRYTFYAFAETDTYKGATMIKGEEEAFTTLSGPITPAEVVTLDAENIEYDKATLKGSVTKGSEDITERGFKYVTKGNYDTVTVKVNTSDDDLTSVITNLNASTEYIYYAYVKTAKNLYRGEDVTFTTANPPAVNPTVTTQDAENITYNSASLRGTVQEGNVEITEYGFAYKVADTETFTFVDANVSGKNMVASAINLSANTEYVYYAFVKTATETISGETLSFTTKEAPVKVDPEITLNDASADITTATLSAVIVKGSEDIIKSGFRYRMAEEDTWSDDIEASIGGNGLMTCEINGLVPETKYEFTAFVTTESGEFVCKENKLFTTKPASLSDAESALMIAVYPNPVTDKVTIDMDGSANDVRIMITDVSGKVIFKDNSFKDMHNITINTRNFVAGVYYLTVTTDKATTTKKLIKQ